MAAPRQGGVPPLVWIIVAALVVIGVVIFLNRDGLRPGSSTTGVAPAAPAERVTNVQSPNVNPGPASLPPANTSSASATSGGAAPPTGGSQLPATDPDAD